MVLPPEADRDAVLANLNAQGIGARSYYAPAVHHHPHFASATQSVSLRNTEAAEASVLSLPIHAEMEPAVEGPPGASIHR